MKEDNNRSEIRVKTLVVPVYIPTLLVMFGYGMVIPVLPLFARSLGAGLGITGVIVAMRGMGSLLFDLPAGAIISRAGRLSALLFATTAAAVIAAATGMVGSLGPLAALTIAMGAMHVLWVLSIQTHIRQNLPSHRRGRAMALVGGTVRMGWVLGPVVGGLIGKTYGLHAVYFGQAAACSVALLVLLIGLRHYRSHTIDLRGEPFRAPGIPSDWR
jgi:MFS family permease